MMPRARSSRFVAPFCGALAFFASACSEESRPIGDTCEAVPLFRVVYDEETKTWSRVALDGGALTEEETERLEAELNRTGPRCLTPIGTATSPSPGDPPGTDAGTGGATGTGGAAATGGASAAPDAAAADAG